MDAGEPESTKKRKNLEQMPSPSLALANSLLTFLWYRLNPDKAAAAAEAHAEEEDKVDALAVSEDALRSARSKDCDLMVTAMLFLFWFCDFLLFSFSSLPLFFFGPPSFLSPRHMLRRPLTRVEISSDDKELVRIERDLGRERGRENIYDKCFLIPRFPDRKARHGLVAQ